MISSIRRLKSAWTLLLVRLRDKLKRRIITLLTPPLSIVRISLKYYQDDSLFGAVWADARL